MSRLLIMALKRAGFEPLVASDLRTYLPKGDVDLDALQSAANNEVQRLLDADLPPPQIWFTYHGYYKSPDLIGPAVASALNIPYVTAEASHAPKRAQGPWGRAHGLNQEALASAAMNFCFTERDRTGLLKLLGDENKVKHLPPFVDVSAIPERAEWKATLEHPARLLTVAMMRADVKVQSYQMLARALQGLEHLDWTLDIVGDGDARAEVERLFSTLDRSRITWHGQLEPDALAEAYARADLFVWPGFGEAYGMAFLEAQAAGLAVVAQNTKGIPAVVEHARTGLLTPEGDLDAYRRAISELIENRERLVELGRAASVFARQERSVETASSTLKITLERLV